MPWKKANLRPDQWEAIQEEVGPHGSVSSYVQELVDDELGLNDEDEEVGA